MDEKWAGNGWTTYQKLVLSQLESHQEALDKINDKLNELKIETTILKVKAGIFGFFAGMIPVLIEIYINGKK